MNKSLEQRIAELERVLNWEENENLAIENALNDALEIIEELQEENKWQDIASAPKDGTDFLAINDIRSAEPMIIWWCANRKKWDSDIGYVIQPTHWLAIPKPPIKN